MSAWGLVAHNMLWGGSSTLVSFDVKSRSGAILAWRSKSRRLRAPTRGMRLFDDSVRLLVALWIISRLLAVFQLFWGSTDLM